MVAVNIGRARVREKSRRRRRRPDFGMGYLFLTTKTGALEQAD
jgi:hypothetical protein